MRLSLRLLCGQRVGYVHAKTIRCPSDGAAEACQIKQDNFRSSVPSPEPVSS